MIKQQRRRRARQQAAMANFVQYLREHERQAFIIGCHGSSYAQLAHVLREAGIEHRGVFLGPLSRRELRDLARKRVGGRSAEIVDKVLGFVRGQSLSATPRDLIGLG